MLILGIDEAGRGALVGPLVICGAMVEESKADELVKIGVKDSKLLTPEQREMLYGKLKNILKDFIVIKIPAEDIDELRKRKNLNQIEAERMAAIIRSLDADVVYVDAPQVSTDKFKSILLAMIDKKVKIIAENYADRRYPIVGAASIIAKVERDTEIERIKREVGVDFGVGYPHDERTIKFVKDCIKNKKYLQYVRKSWATYLELSGKQKQKKLAGYCVKL